MAKMTTEQYGRIAADVLSLPPKNRAMLERALAAKREQEDAQRQHKVEGRTVETTKGAESNE